MQDITRENMPSAMMKKLNDHELSNQFPDSHSMPQALTRP